MVGLAAGTDDTTMGDIATEEEHGQNHLQQEEQPPLDGVARKISDTRPPAVATEYACAQRKHSSGDLHSRLKTRKILGVGETDNGDVHRSKISQVLGHNEHLYVKLPRGFWTAHVLMGVGVSLEAVLLLLMPGLASRLGILPSVPEEATAAVRVAGAALAGLCVFVWSLLGTSDKHYARTMLLSMLTYCILSICVATASALTHQKEGEGLFESQLAIIVGIRALMCLLCLAYYSSIAGYAPIRGQKPSGFRQPSHGPKEH
ncbi:tumor protein p53-inducible protein 11-like isoform X2 [Panulirus ornatus]|uniref:tumor protein p53-inducible protein 11-like isoform X2 n=1 Tax=Panulirus ornatus TaxID=150431 RepID=UPI003A87E8E9